MSDIDNSKYDRFEDSELYFEILKDKFLSKQLLNYNIKRLNGIWLYYAGLNWWNLDSRILDKQIIRLDKVLLPFALKNWKRISPKVRIELACQLTTDQQLQILKDMNSE